MLQYFRTCYSTILGYMTNEDDGRTRLLGKLQHHGRTLPYLAHTARRRIYRLGSHGLDGVNDDNVGAHYLDVFEDSLNGSLADDLHVGYLLTIALPVSIITEDAVCPQLQLLSALLARDV